MSGFDDFLGLSERDLSRYRLIVFHGRSGSGKSTAIRFVAEHHFREDLRTLIVIDEVRSLGGLWRLRRLLRADATFLIASHVAPAWFRLFCPLKMLALHTDRCGSKIQRHLNRHGVTASAAAIAEYVRRFGATYTDADLILERFPSPSFDHSLRRFLKFSDITLG